MPFARSAKKMRPAHVPQIGRPSAAKLLSSGIRPQRSATSAIVVLSPAWRWMVEPSPFEPESRSISLRILRNVIERTHRRE